MSGKTYQIVQPIDFNKIFNGYIYDVCILCKSRLVKI